MAREHSGTGLSRIRQINIDSSGGQDDLDKPANIEKDHGRSGGVQVGVREQKEGHEGEDGPGKRGKRSNIIDSSVGSQAETGDEQPGENDEEQPGGNGGEQPGENDEEQPGGNGGEQPGENDEEQPGGNGGEQPGDGTDGPPSGRHEKIERIGLALFAVILYQLQSSYDPDLPELVQAYLPLLFLGIFISTISQNLARDTLLPLNLKLLPLCFYGGILGYLLFGILLFMKNVMNLDPPGIFSHGGFIAGISSGLLSGIVGTTIGILEAKRYHPFPGDLLRTHGTPKLLWICIGAGAIHLLQPVIVLADNGNWPGFVIGESFVLFNLVVVTVFALLFLREARSFTSPKITG